MPAMSIHKHDVDQNTQPAASTSLLDSLPADVPHPTAEVNGEFWIELIDDIDDLATHHAAWDDLASDASEPNVFYERWMLEPAVRGLPEAGNVRFLLIYRRGKRPDIRPRLCGFLPLIIHPGGITRCSRWEMWGHKYCFLRAPLIRQGHATETLNTLFALLAGEPVERAEAIDPQAAPKAKSLSKQNRPALFDMPLQVGEGPLAQAFIQVAYERSLLVDRGELYNRALLKRSSDWQQYAAATTSNHNRRELRRQWRRLREAGQITEQTLQIDNDRQLNFWIDSFLQLESQGWKGTEKTALSQSTAGDYFRNIAHAAYERGRLQMFALLLNGEPIAMKVNLLALPGSFAFKIAYDERYAKFSPGVHLELENIRRLHDEPSLQWMDSCASPRHFMINRLWKDRRTIEHLRISTGSLRGNMSVGTRLLLRAIRRSVNNLQGK